MGAVNKLYLLIIFTEGLAPRESPGLRGTVTYRWEQQPHSAVFH